jgi:hypothetical protein
VLGRGLDNPLRITLISNARRRRGLMLRDGAHLRALPLQLKRRRRPTKQVAHRFSTGCSAVHPPTNHIV